MLLVKLLAVANQVLHQLIHLSKGGGVDGGELLRRSLERGQHRLEAPCLSVCPQLLADPGVHLGSQDSFGVFCLNISTGAQGWDNVQSNCPCPYDCRQL